MSPYYPSCGASVQQSGVSWLMLFLTIVYFNNE